MCGHYFSVEFTSFAHTKSEPMTTRYALLPIIGFFPLGLLAQTQNALDFDGIDDQVTVANASALIANETAFSMTSWVFPTQTANWPNMEAIAGFRDNLECDFYLLQTYGTTLEGRFRSNANQVFTVDSTGVLVLNTWQFVALTYDGAYLSMYRNGVLLKTSANLPAPSLVALKTNSRPPRIARRLDAWPLVSVEFGFRF